MINGSWWSKIARSVEILLYFLISDSNNNSLIDAPHPEMELIEFEPWFKSAQTRFKLSAGLNLETFDTILSGTNHI